MTSQTEQTNQPNKRSKETTVLKATKRWAIAYAAYAAEESELNGNALGVTEKALAAAQNEVNAHTAEVKEHPGAEYYEIQIGNKQVRKARCKFCAKELNPRGVTRHILSVGCIADYGAAVGLDGEEDADELHAEVKALAAEFGVEFPKPASKDGEGNGDED